MLPGCCLPVSVSCLRICLCLLSAASCLLLLAAACCHLPCCLVVLPLPLCPLPVCAAPSLQLCARQARSDFASLQILFFVHIFCSLSFPATALSLPLSLPLSTSSLSLPLSPFFLLLLLLPLQPPLSFVSSCPLASSVIASLRSAPAVPALPCDLPALVSQPPLAPAPSASTPSPATAFLPSLHLFLFLHYFYLLSAASSIAQPLLPSALPPPLPSTASTPAPTTFCCSLDFHLLFAGNLK